MITNFKIFEEHTDTFNNKFWYINGDEKDCNFILKKFKRKFKIDSDYMFNKIVSDKPIIGIYFGKIPTSLKNYYRWDYFPIENINAKPKQTIIEMFEKKLGCKFAGELKFEKNKFFIDTILVDSEKYNI